MKMHVALFAVSAVALLVAFAAIAMQPTREERRREVLGAIARMDVSGVLK